MQLLGLTNTYMGTTAHSISDKEKVVVLINYSTENFTTNASIKDGWEIVSNLYGHKPFTKAISIKPDDALAVRLIKN